MERMSSRMLLILMLFASTALGFASFSFFRHIPLLRALSLRGGNEMRGSLRREGASRKESSSSDVVESDKGYDYDVIVIGGGSGGLAAAKEANRLGLKVAVLDFVKPSPQGSKWGLGGTCVNVGCIPKKLMHTAALVGDASKEAVAYGWEVDQDASSSEIATDGAAVEGGNRMRFSWDLLRTNVQNYIKKLNFGYRSQLRGLNIPYLNKLGKFLDAKTILCTDAKGNEEKLTAKSFIIAVGGRPTPLECPGAELAISSDDIFMKDTPPGKTCVVGAGYVALECAGFINGLQQGKVVVIVRSTPLRLFDRDVVARVLTYMEAAGMDIKTGLLPKKIEKTAGDKLKVWYSNGESDEFDTVLAAVGRRADTSNLGLENIGVKTNPSNGKIICQDEQTTCENVYAIGDVVDGAPELTPSAIHAGKLLARRLAGDKNAKMDYKNIATTVFTPLELGTIGLTEEEAIEKYGKDNVDSYASVFEPLEWALLHKPSEVSAYAKVVVNKAENNKIVGMHIASPNAGEIMQGFALAFRKGITHEELLETVGIHPTIAEQFTMLDISKSSGQSIEKSSC